MLAEIRELAVHNMKRVVSEVKEDLSLEHILKYVDYKTVWHPIGY
jgi:hypothetical protein